MSAIGVQPFRGASLKARVESLNSATLFVTVRYDRAESPQTSVNSLIISVAIDPFRVKYLMTARYSVFDALTNNP